MLQLVLNDLHFAGVLADALSAARHRLFIATADVKDLHIPVAGGSSASIVDVFRQLARRGVQVNLLHAGVPSGPFLAELKAGVPATLCMRRCIRVHAKAVIADGRRMYIGSANLTGAGLGAKSATRRNFEAGIWTDQMELIDPVLDMLEGIFSGGECGQCGRKEHCPVPLEEPEL
jgi:phosphatidylserine/phosphatidylglycerophosphate/cardiolipin synthase-like enzyme